MKKIYKRNFVRTDKRKLLLYGYTEHNEVAGKQLETTEISKPHMRWNPSRDEWVTYSDGRKNRTFFPPKEYCPLCPGSNLNFPTEIPFSKFEIAVFPNRWASFSSEGKNINLEHLETAASKGECEVVVYSDKHSSTLSDMSLERISLLIHTWKDRYSELLKKDYIKYVLPFENRGEECGVTLHHPHGQIYAYPFIPPVALKEVEAFKKENFILKMIKISKNVYTLYENECFIVMVPPFARYAYEIWIVPKKRVAGLWAFSDKEDELLSICLQKIVRAYDNFLGKKCPYIMGLHSSPNFDDKNFHFHVEFYPPLRHEDKPKILAGSESMAGVFIMDVLPEDSARTLKKFF